MPSFWPWKKEALPARDDGVIPSIGGVAGTAIFEERKSGAMRTYGGEEGGIAMRQLDQVLDRQAIIDSRDARATVMNIESIDVLTSLLPTEFEKAAAHVEKRKAEESSLQIYDYENDRRFLQWKEDQQSVRDKLHIHWLDDVIDKPLTFLVYYLRVCVTAGAFYGVGRTTYLYRTMDRMYARLNGVTIGSIAFSELTTGIAKGGVVAVSGMCGVEIGEVVTNLCSVIYARDVSAPDRTWPHIVSCGAGCGLFSGVALSVLHRQLLTPWAMRRLTGLTTLVGSLIGGYLGYAIYRPFSATRTHRLYEPYWRPWQERRVAPGGPPTMRGKYM